MDPVGSRSAFSAGFTRDLAEVWAEKGKASMLYTAEKQLRSSSPPARAEQHDFRRAENIKRCLDAELYFYVTLLLRSGLRF